MRSLSSGVSAIGNRSFVTFPWHVLLSMGRCRIFIQVMFSLCTGILPNNKTMVVGYMEYYYLGTVQYTMSKTNLPVPLGSTFGDYICGTYF